jgi:hypothetical protein
MKKKMTPRDFEIDTLIEFIRENPGAVFDEDFELSGFDFEHLSYEDACLIIELYDN